MSQTKSGVNGKHRASHKGRPRPVRRVVKHYDRFSDYYDNEPLSGKPVSPSAAGNGASKQKTTVAQQHRHKNGVFLDLSMEPGQSPSSRGAGLRTTAMLAHLLGIVVLLTSSSAVSSSPTPALRRSMASSARVGRESHEDQGRAVGPVAVGVLAGDEQERQAPRQEKHSGYWWVEKSYAKLGEDTHGLTRDQVRAAVRSSGLGVLVALDDKDAGHLVYTGSTRFRSKLGWRPQHQDNLSPEGRR